jgi:hypothetical protein
MSDDAPQTAAALALRLEEEGCLASSYAIGERGGASDAYCLTRRGALWHVYYTERGVDQAPLLSSTSEAEACAFLFRQIMSFRHDHCVGFFRSAGAAEALASMLGERGIACWRDQIPYGPRDPRHRVFVTGRAIFAARALLGEIPARD